jgi:hypothetical protein
MRSTTTEVKNKINAHILSYFEQEDYQNKDANATSLDNLKDQMKAFDHMPTAYAGGKYMAEGGTFLIYNQDISEFLNDLGINPEGKEYPDHKVFEQYCHLIGRQVAELVKA